MKMVTETVKAKELEFFNSGSPPSFSTFLICFQSALLFLQCFCHFYFEKECFQSTAQIFFMTHSFSWPNIHLWSKSGREVGEGLGVGGGEGLGTHAGGKRRRKTAGQKQERWGGTEMSRAGTEEKHSELWWDQQEGRWESGQPSDIRWPVVLCWARARVHRTLTLPKRWQRVGEMSSEPFPESALCGKAGSLWVSGVGDPERQISAQQEEQQLPTWAALSPRGQRQSPWAPGQCLHEQDLGAALSLSWVGLGRAGPLVSKLLMHLGWCWQFSRRLLEIYKNSFVLFFF